MTKGEVACAEIPQRYESLRFINRSRIIFTKYVYSLLKRTIDKKNYIFIFSEYYLSTTVFKP